MLILLRCLEAYLVLCLACLGPVAVMFLRAKAGLWWWDLPLDEYLTLFK